MERFGFSKSAGTREFSEDFVGSMIARLLDSSKDGDKLEGMKQIISYMSAGADVAYFFPNVVKNVATKNMKLKKLVYHFLVHYAELEPEASLLSINSFQKDLSDANPVIRALALRVLSSIRLPVIVQIVVLSIQKCVQDSSPYVRKAAAHAVTKVYAMDREQKDTLREFIVTLLNERSVAALGSAVAAFNDVCPDEWDLFHQHYRKICIMVVDSDEWSQVHMINALTRYARAHFVNPNLPHEENERLRKRQQGWDEEDDEEEVQVEEEETLDSLPDMDADHRLLLSALAPLLNSRNDQVVLAVVAAFYYVAPAAEAQRSGRALVRMLRSPVEIQFVMLTAIVSMAAKRPSMFSQHVSAFLVRHSDPVFVATLKLEVLTHIADAVNIHTILGEFNYCSSRDDKALVAASIQAIGRVAATLPRVTDDCMSRLLALLNANASQLVLAESVVVIQKLLQLFPNRYPDAIERLARSLDKVSEPRARASIVWAIGEYAEAIPVFAPDILRKLCVSFAEEVADVKVQALNLAVKLHFRMPTPKIEALFRYLLELASFDLNYDVRDKARLLSAVFASTGFVGAEAEALFLLKKPLPKFLDPSEGRQRFTLGSLSLVLNSRLPRFMPLPEFVELMDEEAREQRVTDAYALSSAGQQHIPDRWDESNWDRTSESDDWEDEDEEEEEEEEDEWSSTPRSDALSSIADPSSFLASTPTPDFDALFSGGGGGDAPATPSQAEQASMLDNIFSGAPAVAAAAPVVVDPVNFYPPSPKKLALVAADEAGGLAIEYSFQRRKSAMGDKYATVELAMTNEGDVPVQGVVVSDTMGQDIHPFPEVAEIKPGVTVTVDLSVHFPSAADAVEFQMGTDEQQFTVSIAPVVGELLRATVITLDAFQEERERLQEEEVTFTFPSQDGDEAEEESGPVERLFEVANVFRVKGTEDMLFFGEAGIDTRVYVEVQGEGGTIKSSDNGEFAKLLAQYLSSP